MNKNQSAMDNNQFAITVERQDGTYNTYQITAYNQRDAMSMLMVRYEIHLKDKITIQIITPITDSSGD